MRPPQSTAERLYRWLLGLLPADFRGDFGDSMAADFRDRERALAGRARRRLYLRELPALLLTTFGQWLAAAGRDARFTGRLLSRAPAFTLAAIAMLAIGTGANAAIFSVIDAVLLRPAAFDPSRVALVDERAPGQPPSRSIPFAHLAVLARLPEFAGVAGTTGSLPILVGAGAAHRLDVECVSPSLFDISGVAPILGRVFTPAEDRPGADPVLVLSYLEWQRDFGASTTILGRAITLDGVSNTVIGVMPAGFLGPTVRNRVGAWAPLMPSIGRLSPTGCGTPPPLHNLAGVARVRPPLTLDAAAARVNAAGRLAALTTSIGRSQPDPRARAGR